MTSETLVNIYQTTRRYNPEDSHLRSHQILLYLYLANRGSYNNEITRYMCRNTSGLRYSLFVESTSNRHTILFRIWQCCATFLHSQHTKYCRRVMVAHHPHFAYWVGGWGGGKMVYGIDWPRQFIINLPQPQNVLFDVHNYPSLLLRHLL
jgi:hypothetical protein